SGRGGPGGSSIGRPPAFRETAATIRAEQSAPGGRLLLKLAGPREIERKANADPHLNTRAHAVAARGRARDPRAALPRAARGRQRLQEARAAPADRQSRKDRGDRVLLVRLPAL